MFCKKCGTMQKSGQKFCPKCGTLFVVVDDDTEPVIPDSKIEREQTQNSVTPYKTIIAIVALAGVIVGLLAYLYHRNVFEGLNLCFFNSNSITSDIDGIPYKSSEKGKWGMLRPDGKILFDEEFKDVPTMARNGRFMVKNGNGLWEIYTATANPEKIGDEYISIGEFYNGVAPAVKKNEHISLIDKDGNVIAVLDKSGSKSITRMENFHYGYAIIEADDAVGIVNTKGDILLEAKKYCKIYHVAPQRFLALDMKYKEEEDIHNFVFDVIDPVGNQKGRIKMSKYDDIAVLADGYIGIEQTSDGEKLYGIMDLDGNVILKPTSKIRGLSDFRDGKFIFSNGDCLGVRNIKDEVLIRAKYDGIVWATDDWLWVNSSVDGRQEWNLIDLEGNKITKEGYQSALPFFNGKNALVQITDKTWGIIDKNGEELKNTPDIYSVVCNNADEVIESDFVDIDAIVSAVKITPNGFGGFGINMNPRDLIKVYNENCEESARLKLDPNEVSTDRLSYQKEIMKGVTLDVNLYYTGYMTERGESHFDETVGEWIQAPISWTHEFPQYIKMSVSGPKLEGKTKLVYKKLVVKAKTYGSVFKENDNACIIIRKNNNGLVIVNTGSEVWAMVKSAEALQHENIEQFSNNRTSVSDAARYSGNANPVVEDTAAIIDDYMQ